MEDLLFALKVAKFVKSNCHRLCAGGRTLGVGAGPDERVNFNRIAVAKAARRGSISKLGVASDRLLPLRRMGFLKPRVPAPRLFIQPGGSIKDAEVIKPPTIMGLPWCFTGMRHFRH